MPKQLPRPAVRNDMAVIDDVIFFVPPTGPEGSVLDTVDARALRRWDLGVSECCNRMVYPPVAAVPLFATGRGRVAEAKSASHGLADEGEALELLLMCAMA